MKKIIIHSFAIIIYFSISACGNSAPFLSITSTPSSTYTPIPSVTPSPSPTSSTPEVPALVKTSLEFYRNGKAYEIIIGYGIGNAFFYATPRPEIPENLIDVTTGMSAELKRYGDFDNDSEREFIVSILACGANCSETIRLYEYNAEKDEYYVAYTFNAPINDITDINNDGSLEFITTGPCVIGDDCSGGWAFFSALKILRYENNKFVEVTSEFPELIENDAEKFLKLAKENKDDAAYNTLRIYLFDMYRLGKMDEALSVFDKICAEAAKQPLNPAHNYSQNCAEIRQSDIEYIEEYFKKTGIKP
jgi:hypothetical protein